MAEAKKQHAKKSASRQAVIVSADGTDDEIAARCAKEVPGWDKLEDRVKKETVRLMRRFWELPTSPGFTASTDGEGHATIGPTDSANLTLFALRCVETFASNSPDFSNERVEEIYRYLRKAKGRDPTSQEISAAVAFVRGADPQDAVQSTLAVQMCATHSAAMKALGRMESAEFLDQAQAFGNLGSKLVNAFTRQAETLAKLQRGGEQVIKHIHIDNRGGQAVVTEQLVTGGQNGKTGDQPHGTGSAAQCAALLGPHPAGNGMPVAGNEGKEPVPITRGRIAGRT